MTGAHDLSFMALFWQADIIVKSVMAVLAFASVICWTIIIEKIVRLSAMRRQVRRLEVAARQLDRIGEVKGDLPENVVAAGLASWRDYDKSETRAERRDRIERAMRGAMTSRLRRAEQGLPFLATI